MKNKNIALLASLLIYTSNPWADETQPGDPTKGREFYGICAGCHGLSGEGNPALKAPKLSGQYDWYIVTQLMNFRSGVRGSSEEDTNGAMMRPMSLTLPDDQAVKDVAAYIATLN